MTTEKKPAVLLIYTGGTIGMIENPETGALESFRFDELLKQVPELKRFNFRIDTYSFHPAIDSSDMEPELWGRIVESVLQVPGLKAVVLRTFGSGNAPQKEWLINHLKRACEQGILIVNITQCQHGGVEMHRYSTGLQLLQAGVVSGYDCTPECAITKLMFLLGHDLPTDEVRKRMDSELAGEITRG